jgi:hypothetical protein
MTTSLRTSLTSAVLSGDPLSEYQLEYFRERWKNRIHARVLRSFMDKANSENLTRADIARRLGKRPEQITRWLGAPGNWTLDTVSDLLLAMGQEPVADTIGLDRLPLSNRHYQWPTPTRASSNSDVTIAQPREFQEGGASAITVSS